MTGKIQIRLAVLAALAALTAVLVPAGLASGTHETPAPGTPGPSPATYVEDYKNGSLLRLQLDGATDQFVYGEWNGGTSDFDANVENQVVGPAVRCELDNVQPGAVDVTIGTIESEFGTPGTDGTGKVGTRVTGPRGTGCAQTDIDEGYLAVGLAGTAAGYVMDYAEVDIEGKHDVNVSVQAFLGNLAIGGPIEVINCEGDTDCGPDSVDNDNFRIIIAVAGSDAATFATEHPNDPDAADAVVPNVFNRLEFTVTSLGGGEFSLSGGADGTAPGPLGDELGGTLDSLFHLTDAPEVACEVEQEVGGDQFGGSYLLYGCESKQVIFILDSNSNRLSIINIGPVYDDVYALEDWTFLPRPESEDPSLEYNDADLSDPNYDDFWFDGRFCLIDPRLVGGGLPGGLVDADFDTILPLNEQTVDPTDRHTTCIIVEERTTTGQEDFGSGLETAVQGHYILFSIADASRGFR